ncbi:MAG: PKD domain-containing protein [candidate division KSB1 bacterium]|nr:PKD domain-containing protein [candidate division KSB1 bacterium]
MRWSSLIVLAAFLFLTSCKNHLQPTQVPVNESATSNDHLRKAGAVRYLDEIFPDLITTRDIPYSQSIDENGDMQTHYMDIYEPANDNDPARAMIILAPGGGFSKVDKQNKKIVDLAKTFARRGYVTATITYRVHENRKFDGTEPDFPQVVLDAQYDGQAAVRWMRANKEQYRIDSDRIVFAGVSAGAFVALNVTYNYEDTGNNYSNPGFPSHTVAAVDISGAMVDDTMMMAGDPPVIIFHGTDDTRVDYNEALQIRDRAQAVGVTYEFHSYQGEGHNLLKNHRDDIVQKTASFLYNYVINVSRAPVANAGPDQTVVDSDGDSAEVVTLDGSGSSDADGTITAYEWTEGTTVLGTAAVIQTSLSVGVHTITLTVTDNDGNQAQDEVVITVKANQPPTADAGPDQDVMDVNNDGSEMVTLDGSASSDADGQIVAYQWTEAGTVLGTSAVITPTLALGTHTIVLTITDNGGANDSDTVLVTVSEFVNQPPVADAGGDQTVADSDGSGSEPVTLDGSNSSDPDGSIVSYEWSEAGTVLGTSAVLTVDLAVGSHSITLTVTDDLGATSSDGVLVTVNANQAPTADAGGDQSAAINTTLTFDGSGSSDPDGQIVQYNWDFGDGATATGQTVNHAYRAAGTYTVTLTVTDNGGLMAQDQAMVTISSVQPDVVTITKAKYLADKRKLKVEATSSKGGQAVLTVEGFGVMTYKAKKDKYTFSKKNVDNPGSVTVISDLGGSDTSAVKVK